MQKILEAPKYKKQKFIFVKISRQHFVGEQANLVTGKIGFSRKSTETSIFRALNTSFGSKSFFFRIAVNFSVQQAGYQKLWISDHGCLGLIHENYVVKYRVGRFRIHLTESSQEKKLPSVMYVSQDRC